MNKYVGYKNTYTTVKLEVTKSWLRMMEMPKGKSNASYPHRQLIINRVTGTVDLIGEGTFTTDNIRIEKDNLIKVRVMSVVGQEVTVSDYQEI